MRDDIDNNPNSACENAGCMDQPGHYEFNWLMPAGTKTALTQDHIDQTHFVWDSSANIGGGVDFSYDITAGQFKFVTQQESTRKGVVCEITTAKIPTGSRFPFL